MDAIQARYEEYIKEVNEQSLANVRRLNTTVALSPVKMPIERFETRLMGVVVAWCLKGDGEHFSLWLEALGDVNGNRLHSTIDVISEGELAFVVPPPYNELDIPLGERAEAINVTVSNSVSKLNGLIENGETRAILHEDTKIETALESRPDNVIYLRNIVLLAKIWKYYDLDVTQVLGEKMSKLINLDDYDIRGNWIGSAKASKVAKDEPEDYDEDEYEI